jgi:hypothetical protein
MLCTSLLEEELVVQEEEEGSRNEALRFEGPAGSNIAFVAVVVVVVVVAWFWLSWRLELLNWILVCGL